MNRLAITGILAATILAAGIFALIPAQFKMVGYNLERAFELYYGLAAIDSSSSTISYERNNCANHDV
jgi:hypothetical protein